MRDVTEKPIENRSEWMKGRSEYSEIIVDGDGVQTTLEAQQLRNDLILQAGEFERSWSE